MKISIQPSLMKVTEMGERVGVLKCLDAELKVSGPAELLTIGKMVTLKTHPSLTENGSM